MVSIDLRYRAHARDRWQTPLILVRQGRGTFFPTDKLIEPARVFNPGWMGLRSLRDPVGYPYHRNGKSGFCHPDYWDLCASFDHIIPRSAGGRDDLDNAITLTMRQNCLEKRERTLDEMGWEFLPYWKDPRWDGMTRRFIAEVQADRKLLNDQTPAGRYVRLWYDATKRGIKAAELRASAVYQQSLLSG